MSDDHQTCGRCGDDVYALSTDGICDGCVAEDDSHPTGRDLAGELRALFRIGTRTRRYGKVFGVRTDLHAAMVEAIENAVQLPGYYGPDRTAVLRTAWGAVLSYRKHVKGFRIDGELARHINELSAYQFAALLGRMADAGVTTTGEGERFFDTMSREVRGLVMASAPYSPEVSGGA